MPELVGSARPRVKITVQGGPVSGGSIVALGEIMKVTLVEQVIEITKPKLLSFRWFAWMYGHWEAVLDRMRTIRAWQAIKRHVHPNCPGAADEGRHESVIIHGDRVIATSSLTSNATARFAEDASAKAETITGSPPAVVAATNELPS